MLSSIDTFFSRINRRNNNPQLSWTDRVYGTDSGRVTKPIQLAFRVLRQERNFAKAARAAKLSPERWRKYAIERGLIEKSGRRWRTRPDLPRRM
jgi:hypothetical protein